MLCDICKKNVATVHLTQMVEGKTKKVDLCEACSKEKGVDDPTGFSLADLLLGLGAAQDVVAPGPALGHQPLAGPVRGLHDHVHAVGVGRRVAEVDGDLAAQRQGLDPQQLPMVRGRLGFGLERLEEVIEQTPTLRQAFEQSSLPWKPNDWRKQNA